MDVTMLFNDDNDDELSSLAVGVLPSVPGKSKFWLVWCMNYKVL